VQGSNCGRGIVLRTRQCIGGNIGDIGCEGGAAVSESCDLPVITYNGIKNNLLMDGFCGNLNDRVARFLRNNVSL